MILDLEANTVIFEGYTKLTLGQLWSLIELLDDEVDDDEDLLAKLAEKTRPIHLPLRIYGVQSDTARNTMYCVVQFEDGSWACSCPDWIKRRSKVAGTECKHIVRISWRLHALGLAGS